MKLIAINTIGLTGAEILCAELARHPEIRMLPGQNFIRFKHSVYRLHDYRGMTPSEVFEMLSMHHYTRSGKCWSGLSKSMSDSMKELYSREKHRELFVNGFTSLNFAPAIALFIKTFYESMGEDLTHVTHGGWFGNNIAINAAGYQGLDDALIINFSNSIDYWLGNINQRFVWNNLETLKFWIVNELFLRHFARGRKNYLSIDLADYTRDRNQVNRTLRCFLDLDPETQIADLPPDGFIRFNTDLVAKIEQDAASLIPIYKDHALYKLAQSIDQWSEDLLNNSAYADLLEKYRDFWNTSSHTNFDWVGPVEEEIVERALQHTGFKSERNLSCWFYHECFELTCDHYQTPRNKLEHYLGCLEDEIVLPPIAYYARVAVCYIESIADNCLRRPYSAVPIRETSLYRRLTTPAYAKFFPLWAMTEKVAEMEQRIDQANQLMEPYYPLQGKSKERPA